MLGLAVLASYLAWRHHTIRRMSADAYRLFRDARSDSVSRPGEAGPSLGSFNNPVFSEDFRDHMERRDSVVEVSLCSLFSEVQHLLLPPLVSSFNNVKSWSKQ